VRGYHLRANDGEIGHVEDFIFDAKAWAIRHIVANTRNWLPGRNALLVRACLGQIHWAERKMGVAADREAVKNAPAYTPGSQIDRQLEIGLHKYFGVPGYWLESDGDAGGASPERRDSLS